MRKSISASAPPVFHGKRIKSKRLDLQPRTGLNRRTRGLRARAVACNPRQVPLLRPPSVSIHDHGHVSRQALQIQPFEEPRLFGGYRAQRAGGGNLQRLVCVSMRHGVPRRFFFTPQS
jgi:hypothetical protein